MTEINKQLNEIYDGDKLQAKIIELGHKGISIEDLDSNLLEFILDGFIDYCLSYRDSREENKKLKEKISCNEFNMDCRNKEIKELKAEIQVINQKNYDKTVKIGELESTLDCFMRLINKFC